MRKVVYFHESSGEALQMAINEFAEGGYEILQISYCDVPSGHSCMVLYRAYKN